jgi:2-oxoacid:acceptor oxidoreductase delta subunit (pyruvate/2-ketoisovalerate family)
MKPFAITLDVGTSLANHTGSWRTARPEYVDRLPPCNATCPAGENIQSWLYAAEEGDYRGAWEQIMQDNPLPAVMGRACYHTCESACNRGRIDSPVGIHGVERFLGDFALQAGWQVALTAPESGKRVLVLGAGPAGLSCAYHLRRLGHGVTVVDAAGQAGGMLRYGIPRYRLPRPVLDGEIARIAAMGVEFRLGTRVDDVMRAKEEGGYDAAFLAFGAPLARSLDLPQDGTVPVLDAIEFLRQVETAPEALKLGHRVVIYGGGNVAMDAARSARRLGCESVTVIVREDRHQMPAHAFEIKEALEEGVQLTCLRAVTRIAQRKLTLERMVLDDTATPRPTGETMTLVADALIVAIGQGVDSGPLANAAGLELLGGAVRVDETLATGVPGLFAGGDIVPSPRTMTQAIGHGKKAARTLDAFLRGETRPPAGKHEQADFERLNPWYYTDAPAAVQPMLDAVRRQSGFEEVLGNFTENNAQYEARRCLSCGNCFECDNCYGICPDNAVIKLGPGNRFRINYDFCKGCGLCAAECPCGAIKMVAEEL